MSVTLQELLQPAGLRATLFPPNSRYQGIDVATWERQDGTVIAYLRRRFVPPSDRFALLYERVATDSDRIDNLAARELGDPELYWRLCDANDAMRPTELTETVGRRLRITLPEGIPGATSA